MSGWQMLAGQVVIFLLAVGGIILFSVLALRFLGPAMSAARPARARAWSALAALACFAGIVACAAAGFFGIGYLLYTAQT